MKREIPDRIKALFAINLPPGLRSFIWYGTTSRLWRLDIKRCDRTVAYLYEERHAYLPACMCADRGIVEPGNTNNCHDFSVTPEQVPGLLRQIEALAWLGEL